MGRIGTKSPYAVVEWCDASSAMRAYCWATLPLPHCVSFAARWLPRLLYGGSAFGQSCSFDSVVPSRARPCCCDGELARPAWCNLRAKCGVGTISPSSSSHLVYVRATVFCLLTAWSMLLLSKRLYSGSYEKRLRFCLAASSRY